MMVFLAWAFVLGGIIIGIISIFYGIKRAKNENKGFISLLFLKKCFKKTSFKEFTGYEIIALGILSILAAVLIYGLYFGIFLF